MNRCLYKIQLLVVPLIMGSALLFCLIGTPAESAEAKASRQILPGPFDFEVLDVIDGDTFRARIPIWLDQHIIVKIRLAGINAPELSGKCPAEKELAQQAKDFAANWLQQQDLSLVDVHYGTYVGRVIATPRNKKGDSLSDALLKAQLAKPYGRPRADWCF